MRKHLKRILTIFILCWMAMHVVAQVNLGPDRDKIFKVSAKSTSNSRVKGDPMVIGPTLYYQMGTLGDYFALSTEYTNEQLAEFTGMTADDFIIPSGESWEIGYVRFTFYAPFALSEIDNYHVIFYNDNYGKPGAIAKELTNQTDVRIEYRNENAYMFDLTVNLSETVTLTNAGKYWVCVLPVTSITTLSSYNQPNFWAGKMLQSVGTSINSQAHTQNPGGGFFSITSWADMSTYWITQNGY
jgi:hypothetical protein